MNAELVQFRRVWCYGTITAVVLVATVSRLVYIFFNESEFVADPEKKRLDWRFAVMQIPLINSWMLFWSLAICLGFMSICGVIFASCANYLGFVFTDDADVVKAAAGIAYIAALFQLADGGQAAAGRGTEDGSRVSAFGGATRQ